MVSTFPWQAVVFDLDGTLLDTSALYTEATKTTFPELGADGWVQFGRRIGQAIDHYGVPGCASPLGIEEEVLRAWIRQWYLVPPEVIQPFPDAASILTELSSAGVRCALNTNRPQEQVVVRELLQNYGLHSFLDPVVTSAMVGVKKPDPAGLFEVCRLMEVRPADCLFVGDSIADMQSGRNAGVRTIGVTTGMFGREELLDHGAWLVVDCLADVCSVVGERGWLGQAN